MENLSSVLKRRRKELGLTLLQIAEQMNVSEATVQRWESGNIKMLRHERIAKLAQILNVPPSSLMGWNNNDTYDLLVDNDDIPQGFSPLPQMVKRPLVGRIACGEPITAEENIEDYLDVPAACKCDFCLLCVGDSMIDANIHDGDIVYIRAGVDIHNGDITAVRIGDEATLKRVYFDRANSSITLVPANSSYSPKTYVGDELSNISIEGKAVGFTHMF